MPEGGSYAIIDLILRPERIEAIADLAWPMVILIVALRFQKPLAQLIGRMKKATVWGNEIEFDSAALAADVRAAISETELRFKRLQPPARVPGETAEKPAQTTGSGDDHVEITVAGSQESLVRASSEISFLPTAPDSVEVRDIEEIARTNPMLALGLIGIELEWGLRERLEARGRLPKSLGAVSLNTLGELAVNVFGFSPRFLDALRPFARVRNMSVHHVVNGLDEITLRRAIQAGIDLLGLVRRVPNSPTFIEKAGLEVFKDAACNKPAIDFEAIIIVIGAVPGATGHITAAVTRRRKYYSEGMQVTWEWEDKDLEILPLWISRPSSNGKRTAINAPHKRAFCGKSYNEL